MLQGQFMVRAVEGQSGLHHLGLLEEAAEGRKGQFLLVEELLVRIPALFANVQAGDWPQELPLCPRAKGCTPGSLLELPQAAEGKCYPSW